MQRGSDDRELTGMAAYFRDPAPYGISCACKALPRCEPGWFSAGCPLHGIFSSVGTWDGEAEFEKMCSYLLPGKRINVKWS